MTTRFEHYRSGALFGVKYIFENIGDGLPGHIHYDVMEEHNIVVTKGTVRVLIDDVTPVFLPQGSVFDLDCSVRHEVLALEPDTRIVNFFLRGMPPDYASLQPSETSGQFDITVGK